METQKHEPKYIACLLDVSSYCSEDFLARCGGAVYLSAFFDDSVNTFCCSQTPSVFVEELEHVPEKYPEDEAARETLNEELLDLPLLCFYTRRVDIEKLKVEHPDRFKALDFTFDEDDDPAEVVREHLQGNPVF
jgi:hypothetical protein